jgi:hypothetical protein
MFYGAINIGSAISSFAMPLLRNTYGYKIAFLFPAALMVMALRFFAAGKRFYAVETIGRKELSPEDRRERRRRTAPHFRPVYRVTFFWCIFDQSGGATTWTLFARDHLDLTLFGLDAHAGPYSRAESSADCVDAAADHDPLARAGRPGPQTSPDRQNADRVRADDDHDGRHVLRRFPREQWGKVSVLWEAFCYVLITIPKSAFRWSYWNGFFGRPGVDETLREPPAGCSPFSWPTSEQLQSRPGTVGGLNGWTSRFRPSVIRPVRRVDGVRHRSLHCGLASLQPARRGFLNRPSAFGVAATRRRFYPGRLEPSLTKRQTKGNRRQVAAPPKR